MAEQQQQMSPEQVAALQERIKNMSPEELKEFQKKQCIFCQIIAGKVQSKKVFEDDVVLAVLDINPANPGHLLLMTKEHYSIMPQIPDDEIAHVFVAAKSLSNAMLRGINAEGTNLIVANGVEAGQRAQHFMLHVIPRKEKDGVEFVIPQKTLSQEQIDQIGDKLSDALGNKVSQSDVQQPEQGAPPSGSMGQIQSPTSQVAPSQPSQAPKEMPTAQVIQKSSGETIDNVDPNQGSGPLSSSQTIDALRDMLAGKNSESSETEKEDDSKSHEESNEDHAGNESDQSEHGSEQDGGHGSEDDNDADREHDSGNDHDDDKDHDSDNDSQENDSDDESEKKEADLDDIARLLGAK